MKSAELKKLKALALHTLEERRALEEYNRRESQLREARAWGCYTEEKLAEIAAEVEQLRLAWCKIHDDNRELNGGRFPAMSYYDALEKVTELVDQLLKPPAFMDAALNEGDGVYRP